MSGSVALVVAVRCTLTVLCLKTLLLCVFCGFEMTFIRYLIQSFSCYTVLFKEKFKNNYVPKEN